MKKMSFAFMFTFLSITSLCAQELNYPELQVVPRATKRIYLEAKEEGGNAWTMLWPIQVSALMTLWSSTQISGQLSEKSDPKSFSPKIGTAVGAFWFGLTTWGAMSYRPYKSAYLKTKNLKGNDTRNELLRERMAEEEIDSLRRLGKMARWGSAISNGLASAYMNASQKTGSTGRIYTELATVMSFLPLLFKTRWEHVADEQEKYKKRIYRPISMNPIMIDPFKRTAATGMNLVFAF